MDFERDWLGGDLLSWAQSVRSGYARAFIISALHQTGVFTRLRDGGPATVAELAQACQIDCELLGGVMHFLLHADKVLTKDGDERFALTPQGREWLFTDMVLTMSYGAVGAYWSILANLVPCLKGDMRYGRDFVRDGRLLAIGSHTTGRGAYPWVVQKIRDLGADTVVDLGCGSGDVIKTLLELDPALSGIGVDIAPGALEEARSRMEAAGLASRASFHLANIFDVGELKRILPAKPVVFNAIMAFHEFLSQGEERIVRLLAAMKEAFAGSFFMLGEFDCLSDAEYRDLPLPQRLHFLFYQHVIHPLTWQTLGTDELWERIVRRAGVELLEVKPGLHFRLTEFVMKF